MRTVAFFCLLLSAAIKDHFRREVWPEKQAEPLPPIRYDGDPTEIYLA